jgi:hypothetical protein
MKFRHGTEEFIAEEETVSTSIAVIRILENPLEKKKSSVLWLSITNPTNKGG